MKILVNIIIASIILSSFVNAQVGINGDGSTPNSSAMLEVKSTDKGFLPPRMTEEQRNNIGSPAIGLLIYQIDKAEGFYYYTGLNWIAITSIGPGANSTLTCIDYDGNAYPTFTIGTQTWMAENLRVTHYLNGDPIPNVIENSTWAGLTTGAYCWYGNNLPEHEKYGALYNWYAVDDSRGLCPEDWHIPTESEWTTFTTYLGGENVAGGKIKANVELWLSPNKDATNISGFTALPNGNRDNEGDFDGIEFIASWWYSTEHSVEYAKYCYIGSFSAQLYFHQLYKLGGLAVRCIKD